MYQSDTRAKGELKLALLGLHVSGILTHWGAMIFPGIAQFRDGQKDIIECVLKGHNVIAVLPTGGGKSLCYQYPSLKNQGLVIVVSPLIALMKDQVGALRAKGLRAGALYSDQSLSEKQEIFNEIKKGGQYLLYLSPERVQKPGFQKWIADQKVLLFAIDEAHCVSQWGHDFRSEYSELKNLRAWRPDVSILALTASATPRVLEDIAVQLGIKGCEKKVYGFYRPNLYYQVEYCESDAEKDNFLMGALRRFTKGRVIIYCGTRKVTEQVYQMLAEQDPQVGYYHAGLAMEIRKKIQDDYALGNIRILVATNAFGMGIDQPDVRLVVHYQLPANIDSLYQEMGRAGRDGQDSTCLLLYSKKDKGLQSFFISSSEAPAQIKSLRWDNLETLIQYAEGGECRHCEILTYYRDAKRIEACGHCDVCLPVTERRIFAPKLQENSKSEVRIYKVDKPKKAQVQTSPLKGQELALFEDLRAWRKRLAKQADRPAFTILSDKALRSLAERKPKSQSDLWSVYGFGEAKIEQYGSEVLDIIENFA